MSVTQSSDFLQPHGLQHATPPYPSLSPGACSNSCPLSRRCHPNISSSATPFSFCLQSFPASGSFPMSQLFTSGGQSIEAPASVLLMNIQGWFPFRLTVLISLLSRGLWRVFSNTTIQKRQFFGTQPSLQSNSHIHTWLLEKPFLWLYVTIYVGKVMSPLFNTLLRFVITFLPRSKHHLISWLQSPSAVILESKKVVSHCLHCFSTYLPWSDRNGWHDLCFLNVEF